MEFKIIDYSERAIAVVGDTKQVKEELKALGGRWNPRLSCGSGWIFPAKHRERVVAYLNNPDKPVTRQKGESRDNDTDRAAYLAEYEKFFSKESARAEARNLSGVVKVCGDKLVAFDKPRIDTEFCFSYGIQGANDTSNEAWAMAERAKSEDYFMSQNMAMFNRFFERLDEIRASGDVLAIYQSDVLKEKGVNVWSYTFMSRNDPKNALWYPNAIEVTGEDLDLFKEAMRQEQTKFEKRLRAYLKRYGTSKLKTWAYWADR